MTNLILEETQVIDFRTKKLKENEKWSDRMIDNVSLSLFLFTLLLNFSIKEIGNY
jgi:hypothetical protein